MRIQTNTAANSALGYMRVNNQATERSIQKLSSGFRINRAADDAAGLAIANQLRADAKTLGQAQKNAAQAGAMLQIADGAAGTLGGIFDRMRELASQGASANIGASTNAQKLQDEWNALYQEADRLITGTKYQGTNVLTGLGAQAAKTVTAGTVSAPATSTATTANGFASAAATSGTGSTAVNAANGSYTITSSAGNVTLTLDSDPTKTQTIAGSSGAGTLDFTTLGVKITTNASFKTGAAVTGTAGTAGSFSGAVVTAASGLTAANMANATYTVKDGTGANAGKLQLFNGTTLVGTSTTSPADGATTVAFDNGVSLTMASFTAAVGGGAASNANNSTFAVTGNVAAAAAGAGSLDGGKIAVTGAVTTAVAASAAPSILVGTSASQGGSTYGQSDSIALQLGTLADNSIRNLSSTGNFEAGGNTTGASLLTTAGSQDALTRLDTALGSLNTFIGKLGAAQSRVDYATQNVNSMLQNTLAAESSIRDADMAAEMVGFTRSNILQQAGTSILAQANQGPNSILSLLR